MQIPFTRFHPPNGRRTETTIEVGEPEFQKYMEAAKAGFRMTVELLRNGAVSQCIEDPELGDFACVVCANGPEVPKKLSEMLLRFNREEASAWRKGMA